MACLILTLIPANTLAQQASDLEPRPSSPPSSQADQESDAPERSSMLILVGPGGEPRYEERFTAWAAAWQRLAEEAQMQAVIISPAPDQLNQFAQAIEQTPRQHPQPHWIVVIAHGAFDTQQAQINLQGPDLTPSLFKQSLANREDSWVIIQGAAASGPFLKELAAPNRIVISATKGPNETNATRWHEHLLAALAASARESDLDLDDQVSLHEAFIWASRSVEESFQAERLIVTEHALLDDNGDGRGLEHAALESLKREREEAIRAGEAVENKDSEGIRSQRVVLLPSPWERARTPEWRAERNRLEDQLAALRRENSDPRAPRVRALLDQLAAHYASVENENPPSIETEDKDNPPTRR